MAQEDRTTGLVGFSGMKVPVRLATTAAITLSGEQTIDGVSAVTGDRVLVKNQTDPTENGIYVVDTGDWNRAADCDGPYDLVQGSLVYVVSGTAGGNKIYKQTEASPEPGTSDLNFQVVDIEVSGVPDIRYCGTATGTANALVLTPSTAVDALSTGLSLIFKTGASANSAAATIAVSGLAATAVALNGAALAAGDLEAGQWYTAMYDGVSFNLSKIGIPAIIHGVTVDGAMTISANLSISGILTPTTITAQQNNYGPSGLAGAVVLRLSSNAAQDITGFNVTANGRLLVHENVGNQPITITANSAASDANMRVLTAGANVALAPNEAAITLYDPVALKHRMLAQPPDGELRAIRVYTTTGANTWTKLPGLKRAGVLVVAAGASAGGVPATGAGQCSASGGGGAGGWSYKLIEAPNLGATETATVGAGGAAPTAGGNSGNAGGSSSFGAHCSATGGVGGAAGTLSGGGASMGGTGALGGVGSGGDVNGRGGYGGVGFFNSGLAELGGHGGSSIFGGGAPATRNNNAGTSAASGAYGAGGAGAAIDASQSAQAGGAGADGIIIVMEYY